MSFMSAFEGPFIKMRVCEKLFIRSYAVYLYLVLSKKDWIR